MAEGIAANSATNRMAVEIHATRALPSSRAMPAAWVVAGTAEPIPEAEDIDNDSIAKHKSLVD
jgi:hypothetical protein